MGRLADGSQDMDDWGEDLHSDQEPELDKEWQARKLQFWNVSNLVHSRSKPAFYAFPALAERFIPYAGPGPFEFCFCMLSK